MRQYVVWAPRASRVHLALFAGGPAGDAAVRRVAMDATDGGFWRHDDPASGHGTRYAFSLDGGPLRPDPRSASQPEGIHGPSEVVDHWSFAWTDRSWRGLSLAGAIIYEVHVGTFTDRGTFDAVIERLSHLVDLGVDAIELMPVVEFSGDRGWGYDGVDLFAPHHGYGGPDGLKRLVDACHQAGLGVILDVVYNHLGPCGNYLPEFGPYLTRGRSTDWGEQVNFDGPGSDEVRRFCIDNALMWLRDYHIDGLRLDAVQTIHDATPRHILEELAAEVDDLTATVRRPLWLIAESNQNDPRLVRSRDVGGFGLHAAWADEWHHALHACLTAERAGYYRDFGSLDRLAKALRQAWVHDGVWSDHWGRRHGRSPAGLSGRTFVVATQTHDQVGNRAAGERLGALTSVGRLRIAATLLLTSPFTPMLFQGQEWAASTPFHYFTAHEDPALGRAVREGRAREFAAFGWRPDAVSDPQSEATFRASKLDWAEIERRPHQEMLAWYRELIGLRRRHPELCDPRIDRVRVDIRAETACVIVHRGTFRIAFCLSSTPVELSVQPVAEIVLASSDAVVLDDGKLRLGPDEVCIYR